MAKVIMLCLLVSLGLFASQSLAADFLRVQGKDLFYGNNKVFLSGANIAWNSYGYDFGNGNYAGQGPTLEQWVRDISAAGGNSLRIWVHVEGMSTPKFNGDGYVLAPDDTGDFLNDFVKFLDVARDNNVLVIPVLWNGAVMTNQNYINLIWDDAKLQSYIDNVLRPWVQRVKGHPALGAWEVINEPEGSVRIEGNSNPCYDTNVIGQQGAGWTGVSIPMERFLRFIGKQNAAIRQEDPKALITLGSWSEHSQNNAFPDSFNHYADGCLIGASEGGGRIDFYQMHTYSWQGKWSGTSPFKVTAGDFNLDKPVVIGEFASVCSENEGVDRLWDYAHNNGYNGAWSWQYNAGGECSDSREGQNQGMSHIRNNGDIPINVQ